MRTRKTIEAGGSADQDRCRRVAERAIQRRKRTAGYDLTALRDDLARFAFLLGDDGEQFFDVEPP